MLGFCFSLAIVLSPRRRKIIYSISSLFLPMFLASNSLDLITLIIIIPVKLFDVSKQCLMLSDLLLLSSFYHDQKFVKLRLIFTSCRFSKKQIACQMFRFRCLLVFQISRSVSTFTLHCDVWIHFHLAVSRSSNDDDWCELLKCYDYAQISTDTRRDSKALKFPFLCCQIDRFRLHRIFNYFSPCRIHRKQVWHHSILLTSPSNNVFVMENFRNWFSWDAPTSMTEITNFSSSLPSTQRHPRKSKENVFLMAYHYLKLFRFPIWD